MIDFHSHILPEMDDGSSSASESLKMLKLSWKMGVDIMVATPHYYAKDESIERFIERRQEKYDLLMREIDGESEIPQIVLGSEVAFFVGMSRENDISKLCINGTRYLLIEMPFAEWSSLTIKEVNGLITNRGIIPIIAHLERFYPIQCRNGKIKELLDLDVLVEVNSEAFNGGSLARKMMKMLSKNEIHLLGSDCHNMGENPPNLDFAFKLISNRLGESQLKKIDARGRSILKG
ncbi:MAG: capsular polysaccharide biosynthesis protein [Oscillospiraceae bacterium]|nr:capsular polysaccharide biosynthesis protein [Oscillospiraceae bacterium]